MFKLSEHGAAVVFHTVTQKAEASSATASQTHSFIYLSLIKKKHFSSACCRSTLLLSALFHADQWWGGEAVQDPGISSLIWHIRAFPFTVAGGFCVINWFYWGSSGFISFQSACTSRSHVCICFLLSAAASSASQTPADPIRSGIHTSGMLCYQLIKTDQSES